MIKTTEDQLKEIVKLFKSSTPPYYNEKYWTYFFTFLIDNNKNKQKYISKIIGEKNDSHVDEFWIEAEPLSPIITYEGNTKLDLSFGAIKQRNKTKLGIECNHESNSDYICFIEAKFLSDCDFKTKHDNFRNQITRVIENLMCFSSKNLSLKLYFTLLTPKDFIKKPKTRLFGYKFIDYLDNPQNILDDIYTNEYKRRDDLDYKKIIKQVKLNWIAYEDVIGSELGLQDLNLLNLSDAQKKVIKQKNDEIADSILNKDKSTNANL